MEAWQSYTAPVTNNPARSVDHAYPLGTNTIKSGTGG